MYDKPQILIDLADAYASTLSHTGAFEKCGVSKPTYWRFLAESKKGEDPSYMIDYLGEVLPFHEAIRRARILGGIHEIEARFLKRARDGHEAPIFYKGEPSWVMAHDLPLSDPRYVPLDCPDDMLELLYGARDRFARHPVTEAKIQRTELIQPPVAAVQAVLAANLPRVYGAHQTIDVNQHNTGRMVIEHRKSSAPRPASPPMPVASPAPLAIEHQPAAPIAESEHVVEPMADAPQAQPLVAVDDDGNAICKTPASESKMVSHVDLSKLTPEQLAARQRLIDLAAKPPANPRPTSKVQIFSPSDEPAQPAAPKATPFVRPPPPPAGGTYQSDDARREGVGTGTPVPGGMKVR